MHLHRPGIQTLTQAHTPILSDSLVFLLYNSMQPRKSPKKEVAFSVETDTKQRTVDQGNSVKDLMWGGTAQKDQK